MRRGRRRATRQGTRERVVRNRGEPLLILAQRQQQVRDPVGGRQLALDGANAEAVHTAAAGRHEQRAALAEQPDAQLSRLESQAGIAL